MAGRLQDKVAIVTGASKGIGAACARLFAGEGAIVLLADVDAVDGEATAAAIRGRATFVRHDVRSEADWQTLIAQTERRHGKLDILVNNAGVAHLGTPETVTEADIRLVFAVSVDGTIFGCKHAIPAMRRAGGGAIVNLASVAAAQGEPNNAAYSAAKGAIDAYTRTVAVHCTQQGLAIRCNAVLPAGMETPMVAAIADRYDGGAGLLPALPFAGNERGRPEDVAHLIVYLASDEARWVNGQSILVDNAASVTRGSVPPRQPA